MTDDPADVAGREHGLAGCEREDAPHRRRQRDRVAAGVALHALGLAGRARRVEDVRGLGGLEPFAGHARTRVLGVRGGEIDVARRLHRESRIEAAVDQDDVPRRMPRDAQRLVDQRLVGNRPAAAHAGVGGEQQRRARIVDARREARRREAAEHDRMDRPDAHAGEHREYRLGDHRHVDQHAVAAAHAPRLQHRRAAVDLLVELRVGAGPRLPRLGRDVDQRRLAAASGQVTVDGVVAEVRPAAREPARERRPRIVENLGERLVPVDELRFLAPEAVPIGDRPAVKLGAGGDCGLHRVRYVAAAHDARLLL